MIASVEILTHLQCPKCLKDGKPAWFSIADRIVKKGEPLFCPKCGEQSIVESLQNGFGKEIEAVEWILPVGGG